MRKILLLGDIHANYPALEAIIKYIQPDRFDWIINTGDFTVYSTFPNETIQWFRKRKKTVCILGNTDRKILRILKGKKLKKPQKKEKRVMYFWTAETLFPENIAYLKSLPKQTDLTVGKIRIGLFHGTLDDPDEELFPSAPESRFHQLAKDSPYQVQIMGHSHVQTQACEGARRSLAISERSNRVYTTDEQGERTYLSDQDRVARIESARKMIAENCN